MGSCAGKKLPRADTTHHPITRKPNPSAPSTADIPEISPTELSDLRKCYEANGQRMHHKVKDCYSAALAGKAVHTSEINMKFVNLGEDGIAQLTKVLPAYGGLKSLKLWKTKLGVEGAKLVGAALPRLPLLEILSLEDNDIKADGAAHIAKGLVHVLLLQELYMHINNISLPGITALSAAISPQSHLRILTVDENQITPTGLHILLTAISNSSQVIHTLGLGFNMLGDEGAREVLRTLKEMPELRKVTLTGNSVSAEVESELKQGISSVYIVI